jgi:nucleotide-binding universal stress UspA family protein
MQRRVLIPLDRSERAEDALKALPSICEKGDEVILLSIAAPEHQTMTGMRPGRTITRAAGIPRPDFPVYAETSDQAAQRQLDELETYLTPKARQLEEQGYQVHMAFELSDHPGEAIAEVAQRVKPTFVLMLRATHYGVQERLFGTAAQHVISQGIAPVMILPGE